MSDGESNSSVIKKRENKIVRSWKRCPKMALLTSLEGEPVGAFDGLVDGERDGAFDGAFEGDWLGVVVG